MNYYKLTIAYDGTDYVGWQEQKNRLSVAQVLKKAFFSAFEKEIVLLGASRTDSGVHALGQIARCKTDLVIDPKKLCWVWNNVLPADVVIRKIELVDDSFHPYYHVEQKTYYYHFFLNKPLPFMQRYGWHYPYPVNFATLDKALNFFVGTHDFRAFRSADDVRKYTIRTIDTITIESFDSLQDCFGVLFPTFEPIQRFKIYRITVKGQKFMRHMIRRLVGASLSVATKKNGSTKLLQEVMAARDPNHSLPNAPAKGLLLYRIAYANKGIKI